MNSFDFRILDKYPSDPGVYLMKNRAGDVIYVGKAKNLRQRVKQYFVPGRDGRPMIPFLVAEIYEINTLIVADEKEALLLENTLIKKHKPKFNVLLKDDKTFISLVINQKHRWPMIKLVRYRGKPKENGVYFGPYTNAYAARQTLEIMNRIFPLRQCSDEELRRRTRPCLLYEIKRCVAPCVGLCTPQEYQTYVHGAIEFLRGHDEKILKELEQAMHLASEALEFEKAAALLQTIRQIQHVTQQRSIVARVNGKDTDALGIYRQGHEVLLVQLFFRDGKLTGSERYSFSDTVQDNPDIYVSFLLQYYRERPQKPEEIVLSEAIAERKVVEEIIGIPLSFPSRGCKKSMVLLAEKNAKALFKQEKDENGVREKMLLDLQETLKLTRFPERIECFDTSTISGTDSVASMVVFSHGQIDRKQTRLFKVRHLSQPDDYAALHQVLTRHLSRAQKDNYLPDLLIVDGGKGQLNIALKVMKELNIATVDLIAIAKDESRHDRGLTQEKILFPHHAEPLLLPLHSPLLFLLQRIRDETHAKALRFHQKRRTKRTISSKLEGIPGIGPIKRQRLLQHFGSFQRICEASNAELLCIRGINTKDIERIRSWEKTQS